MKKMIAITSFVLCLATALSALAQEKLACPGKFSVAERTMILSESSAILNGLKAPSLCFQKLIDEGVQRRQAAGISNLDIKDIVSQLADSAWKAEASGKDF